MGTKKNNLGVRIAMAVIGIALTAASVGLQKDFRDLEWIRSALLFLDFPMLFMRHTRRYTLWCVLFC